MRFVYVSILVVLLCPLNEGVAQLARTVYTASDDPLANPDCGLFQGIWDYPGGGQYPLNLANLQGYRAEGISLIYRNFYLSDVVGSVFSIDSVISTRKLNFIETDFTTIRRAGLRCVIRFVYTDNYIDPDAPLSVVLSHLDQLAPILQANSDVISVMQAGFIGAWGEWHNSTNGLDTNVSAQKTILEKILRLLPKNRMVQVRCIRHKWGIFGSDTLASSLAFTDSNRARVGFHNDAFLNSWDDAGTYSLDPPHWNDNDTAIAKSYLSRESRYTPIGGESNKLTGFCAKANALAEGARLRWSFFNRVSYNNTLDIPDVISQWTADGTLEQMKRRLGYRFSLVDAEANANTTAGGILHLKIRVANTGWASPFNPHTVEVLFRNVTDSSLYGATLPDDPRLWAPGDTAMIDRTIGIPATLPRGTYTLLINLPDPDSVLSRRPEYSIRLANANVWEPGTGYNSLLRTVSIEPGTGSDTYKNLIELRPLRIYSDVDQVSDGRPKSYGLGQNFPNPFNPTTEIQYNVPSSAYVTLKVYDLLGREVDTIYVGTCQPGSYQARWDASGFPSGIYFCRLQTKGFSNTKKMILLR